MAIRLSGLNSGLDTEAIVSAMVSGYKAKKDKLIKSQTKLSWKQDALKSVNAKVYGLYKDINALRFSSAYSLKKTTVSDSTKASVTASGSALNGSQELGVAQLARAGYLTGGQLESGTTGSTKLTALLGDNASSFSGGKITVNGKDISVSEDTTVNNLVDALNDAGVKASYDSTNRRIFISAKNSGASNDFTLTAGDEGGIEALSALGLYTENSSANTDAYASYKKYMLNEDGDPFYSQDGKTTNGTYSAKKTAENIKSVLRQLEDYHADVTRMTDENKALKDEIAYAKAYAGYKNAVKDAEDVGKAGDMAKLEELLDVEKPSEKYLDSEGNLVNYDVTVTEDEEGNKTYTYKDEDEVEHVLENPTKVSDRITELAKSVGLITEEEVTDEETGETSTKTDDSGFAAFKANRIKVKDYEGAENVDSDAVAAVHSAYDSGSIDLEAEDFGEFISGLNDDIESNNTAISTANKYITDNSILDTGFYSDDVADSLSSKINTAQKVLAGDYKGYVSSSATRVNGQDSVIYLNGARFTSASNQHSINGLTINATGVTADSEEKVQKGEGSVTITTATDTDGIYDKVKDFLSKYNEVVNSLSSLYNADSAKGYEPLTDEEREELTDTQAEKWEQKIKDSLLRRDQTIGNIISKMSSAMMKSYSVNGKNYSLASFGIATLGYFNSDINEKYAYHIDGDEDDSDTSTKTDKLRAMIDSDPESVTGFLKQLTDGLYKTLDSTMKRTSMSSAYTMYNDKEMASEYSNYTSQIKKWEDRISTMEESYFKKFTAMEKALSTMQSNSSSLSGLLGG